MSDERPDIPRTDYRVSPKVKGRPKRRRMMKVVGDNVSAFAFIKANLAMRGILNPDGSFKF